MKYEDTKRFCEEKGYKTRADRYRAMEEFFGVEADVIKDIISFDRYLRTYFDIDEIGYELEKEWHGSPLIWKEECTNKKTLKDRLKYS